MRCGQAERTISLRPLWLPDKGLNMLGEGKLSNIKWVPLEDVTELWYWGRWKEPLPHEFETATVGHLHLAKGVPSLRRESARPGGGLR